MLTALFQECQLAKTKKIRGAIAQVFSTVASGQSQVSVSLSRIRTIKVTIIGSKQPGNYSISSTVIMLYS
jgi:protein involved in polysaccharide export with SLBB domain